MSANVFRELLRDFRAAEAEWPVKGYTQFKIWARPFLHNGRIEPGWVPKWDTEWPVARFWVDSGECGYHNRGYHLVTHNGLFLDDDKPVERFTELATKAGAHLSLDFQNHISPKPNSPVDWWLALMWQLNPADDIEYGDNPRIFLDNPFFDSANAIEHCRLHTDEFVWPGPLWPRDTTSPKDKPAVNAKSIAAAAADEEDQSAGAGVVDGWDANTAEEMVGDDAIEQIPTKSDGPPDTDEANQPDEPEADDPPNEEQTFDTSGEYFLHLSDQGETVAAIRDHWQGMSDDQRRAKCSEGWEKLVTKTTTTAGKPCKVALVNIVRSRIRAARKKSPAA